MRYTINDKLLKKYNLSSSQALLMMSVCQKDLSDNMSILLHKGILIKKGSEYSVSDLWKSILNDVFDNSGGLEEEEWYRSLAKDFAQTFPQGKMQGTAYYYRCNTSELVNKFKKFFLSHPEYKPSDEMKKRIVDAARRYNHDMDFNPRYRTLSKYFISKMKPVVDEDGIAHNEEVSQLATYLENKDETDSQEGWMFNSKN